MAVDIIGYLNTQLTDWSAQKKQDMLDDFCSQYNYEDMVDDGEGGEIENPVSKKMFANQKIVEFIKGTVNAYRAKKAREEAQYDELNGDLEAGE